MDRETVIRDLEYLVSFGGASQQSMVMQIATEALTLLKEQETVAPKCKERVGGFVTGVCPTCGVALNNVHNAKACGKCGQAVKWE